MLRIQGTSIVCRALWRWTSLALLLGAAPAARAQDLASDTKVVGDLTGMVSLPGVLTSLLVIAGAWFAIRFVKRSTDAFGERFATQRMFFQKIAAGVQFLIYIGTAGAVFLLSFKLSDEVMAVVGGTIAVSVGFAVKDLVASFIAGVMILIDRPFQVGDRVSFGGQYGDITAIGLRSVRMQTLDDNTVTIPNNKFLNDITSCGNYGALDMQVVIDFYVGVDQDPKLARQLVSEAAVTGNYLHLPKPVVVLVTQVIHENYLAFRLRLKAYVLDIHYEKAFETDITLRVADAFARHGIAPPAMLYRPAPAGAPPPHGT